ncbi:putative orfan [Tupanvirus soda lake]|uniref:Orfan n=2 Tax=Tupanvirus TaxID=2094720 RepID=A0AC62ACC7_9VIRU|nr:putative orfan [Tupanvirus soda lake]QKU35328.1 putative orfan [Tupanvirus soda lake]
MHKLDFKIDMYWYILRVTMRLINTCSNIWINVMKRSYCNPAFKKVVNIFFENYLNYNTKLKKISPMDIEFIENKELRDRLVLLIQEKEKRDLLRMRMKIESARRCFFLNESHKLSELVESIVD